jgi:hypothetical protein
MKSPISPYLPFYFESQATAYLIELIEICDSFDQLSKIAILADFLISPDGINRALIFATIEQVCLKLRGLPVIGIGEASHDK